MDKTWPISESDLRSVLAGLRYLTPEKRRELSLEWPEALPPQERLASLIESEARATEEESSSGTGADGRIADLLSKSNPATIEAIQDALSTLRDARQRVMMLPHSWIADALRDAVGGNTSLWREISRVTRDAIASIEALVSVADNTSIEFPDTTNIKALHEDVCTLKRAHRKWRNTWMGAVPP